MEGMQQLTYACRCLLTPDAVSDALFDLVAALRPGQRPEPVSIPVLDHDGRLLHARLILHPGTELASVATADAPRIVDEDATAAASTDAVAALRGRIAAAAGPVERPAIEDYPTPFTYEEPHDWS